MEELIEKHAALYALCEDCKSKYNGQCPHKASKCIEYRKINMIKSIEAEPVRRGRWIKIEPNGLRSRWKCSECDGIVHTVTDFCPHCGAQIN